MPRRLAMLLPILALTAYVPAGAEVYRVDGASGSDDNDGLNAPFKTIARALRTLETSDTLALTRMDEPYRESLSLRVGGTAEQPLIVEGGGATLSGSELAPKAAWEQRGLIFVLPHQEEVKFLWGPQVRYEKGTSASDLAPEQWWWEEGKLYFQPAEGKTPTDYDLEISVRDSGVKLSGAGQIIVRDLTCEHFWNDGFNIHGGSAPVWFENIRGLWNGDEGFSAHENCECYVRGGEFSSNYWHGIADVNLARTHFANLVVRDNRSKGIYFIGGMHSVIDSEVSGSPINIALSPSTRTQWPRFQDHLMRPCLANFRNVVVRSAPGQVGVQISADGAGLFEHCLISGGDVGVKVDEGGKAYVVNSIVHDAETAEVSATGSYAADHNLYHPGRFVIGETTYSPEDFDVYRAATGNDANSFLEEPKFIGDTLWPSRASHARGGAFGGNSYGGMDIGPRPRGLRPDEDASVLPVSATRTEAGNILFSYDFEKGNPWSRVYPVPVKNHAGVAVEDSSELSDEQAHSGERSAKLTVRLPLGPPATYNIKLFSVKFAYDRPVRAIRYWLYGDGSGRSATLRVRDASGECFYDAPVVVDWTGWRQITWDLDERPPASISAGDGNQVQDGPPMEIVVEVRAEADSEMTLYFDDLEVELAGGGPGG